MLFLYELFLNQKSIVCEFQNILFPVKRGPTYYVVFYLENFN